MYSRDKDIWGCGHSWTFIGQGIGIMNILGSQDPSDVINGTGGRMQCPYLGRESDIWVEPKSE